MLVLTRKTRQQIRIGNDVVITILRVKGNSVRVGVDAPKSVRVIRAELPDQPRPSEGVDVSPGRPVMVLRKTVESGNALEGSPTADRRMQAGLAPRGALARRVALRRRSDADDEGEPGNAGRPIGFSSVLCLRS